MKKFETDDLDIGSINRIFHMQRASINGSSINYLGINMRRLNAKEMLAVAGGDDGDGIGNGTDGGFNGFGDLGNDGFNGGMDPSGADPSGALGFDTGDVGGGFMGGFAYSVDSPNATVSISNPANPDVGTMTFSTIDNALVSAINFTTNDVTVSVGVSIFSDMPGYTISDPFGHLVSPPGDTTDPVLIDYSDQLVRQDPVISRYA